VATALRDRTHLVSESIQEPDSVDLKNRMNSPRSSLEVLKNVVGEEIDDVNKCVCGCDAMLQKYT
jgi:hypothetical protein